MSNNIRWKTELDTSKSDAQGKEVEEKTERINASLVTTIRKTAQIGLSLFQAFGGAIDQSYALGIEAALLSVELYATLATAGALTGVGAFHAAALGASIASLITTIILLEQGRTEAASRMQHVTNITRVLSY